jgi:cytochrome c biogenesis protein CcmG, thiol:disulfide interchange protein DsbE
MASNPTASQRNYLWPAVIAVVVILGVVAIVLARGSGKEEADAVAANQTGEITVTGTALPAYTGPEADPAIGATIPELRGTGFEGEEVVIGPDGAKVIMVVAHWCPVCQREVPRVMSHLEERPMPDDVELVLLSTAVDKPRGNYPPSKWLADEGWEGPTLTDTAEGTGAAALGLNAFPFFVVTDAEGKVIARTSGEISNQTFDQLVDAARSGAS